MTRFLRTLLPTAAVAALLSACTVTFLPGDVGVDVRAGVVAADGGERVDGRWPVTVPPGTRVADVQARSDRLSYELIGTSNVRAVYGRLHGELSAAGWRRTEIDRDRDDIDAEYRRGGLDLYVDVEARGRDRVGVTLELDD